MKSLVTYDKSIKKAKRGRPIPTTPFGYMHGLFLPIFLLPMGKRDWSSPARTANPIERARTSSEAGAAAASVVCSLGEGSAYGGRVRARKRAAQAVLLMENIQVALFPNRGIEIETVFST